MNTQTKKKLITIAGIALILVSVALIGLYYGIEDVVQQPNPHGTYTFITQNFNSTPSTQNLASASSVTLDNNFTLNNATYYFNENSTTIYYLGADFCPFCGVESYDIYAYLHNTTVFPAYSSNNYMTAESGIPAIMPSLEWGISPDSSGAMSGTIGNNINFEGWEIPINLTQLETENSTQLAQAELTVINSMPPQAQYLFSLQSYRFPQIYVVKTTGNQTKVCSAYGGIVFYQTNSTDINQFKAVYNMSNVPLSTVIPDMSSVNYNYNLINQCVSEFG